MGWVGKRPLPLHWDPCEQVFPCAPELSLPGGCDMVMWHHGTSRPPLEIALASACGLALPNFCICSAEFWTAGSSESRPSAVRQQLNQLNKSSTSYFPKPSQNCWSSNCLGEANFSDVSFSPCLEEEVAQVGISPVEHDFFKNSVSGLTHENTLLMWWKVDFFSPVSSYCSFLSCLSLGLLLSYCRWCVHAQPSQVTPCCTNTVQQLSDELQGQVARSDSLSNSEQMAGGSGLCLLNGLCALVQKHGGTWSIFTGHLIWCITQKAFLNWM